MRVETERLILRDMVRSDLDQMQRWRPYSDPLSATWNTRWRSSADMDSWLGRYGRDDSRRVYAITLHDSQVIGRLSLRHIYSGQHAVLGLALGADWVEQGYGTEALRAFMPYYFYGLGFRVMLLDVAAPNLRAVRCYEKAGFERTGEHFRPVTSGEARAFMRMPDYKERSHLLRKSRGQYEMLFYDMEIDRARWREVEVSDHGSQ